MEEEEPLAESAHNKQRMIDKKLRKFRRESPEVTESFLNFWRQAKKPSAIPTKYKELIQFAIVLASHCELCIYKHVKLCLLAGATRAEILDAAAQALAVGDSIVYEYLAYVVDALDYYEPVIKGNENLSGKT